MGRMTKIEKRQRKKKILLSIFLSITILSLISFIIIRSDVFKIRNIEVRGNIKLEEEDIIEHSTVNIGENIFRLRMKDIEERLEKLSYIKEIKVRRSLPATIIIDIVEKEEKALIKTISTYQIIDVDGYVLNQVDTSDGDLPVILGLNIYDVGINDNLFETISDEYVIDLFKEGDKLNLLEEIEFIDVESRNDVKILLKNGIDITFGNLDNVEYRLRLLNEILKDIKEKGINVKGINMNKGDHPVIITDD
ncbi:MAG TPA: FtsQ-type POTRA domain-containing protein [Tissierellaceae bacterium]|nr:FtsQ-type POTRA domain-containing protein [Tissierellaceae bacterium]